MSDLEETVNRQDCDLILKNAIELMLDEGASPGLIIDRLLTFGIAQACRVNGAFDTIKVLKSCIEQIEAGKFAHLERHATGRGH